MKLNNMTFKALRNGKLHAWSFPFLNALKVMLLSFITRLRHFTKVI